MGRKHTVKQNISQEIIAHDYKENCYGHIDGEGRYIEIAPADMDAFFTDRVLNNAETSILWLSSADIYYERILYLLWYMQFSDITAENKPLKKWNIKEYDYTVSDVGTLYRIRIKTTSKKTLTIYNADNLLGKDIDSIRDAYGTDTGNAIKDYTFGVMTAVFMLTEKQSKATPYTISMVAAKRWRRIMGIEYNDPLLIDMHSCLAPEHSRDLFNTLDDYIRASYKGGWNYLYHKNMTGFKPTGAGAVYDVNSLYPYILMQRDIPCGEPTYFVGSIPTDALRDRHYYFVHIKASFNLKDGFLPYISVRHDMRYPYGVPLETSDFIDAEGMRHHYFIDDDNSKKVIAADLVLSKTDYEILHKAYNIESEEVIDGVYFRTTRFLFNDYIDIYYNAKKTSKTSAERHTAKMLLNALTGTLAKQKERRGIMYTRDENGHADAHFIFTRSQSKSYVNMASALTSYARAFIWEKACQNIDTFLYSDTDSLHLLTPPVGIIDDPVGVNISDKLGDFKIEYRFNKAYYYKNKMYVLQNNNSTDFTLAGVSREWQDYLNVLFDTARQEYADKTTLYKALTKRGVKPADRYKIVSIEYDHDRGTDDFIPSKMTYKYRAFERRILKYHGDLSSLYFGYYPNGFRKTNPDGWTSTPTTTWQTIDKFKRH